MRTNMNPLVMGKNQSTKHHPLNPCNMQNHKNLRKTHNIWKQKPCD